MKYSPVMSDSVVTLYHLIVADTGGCDQVSVMELLVTADTLSELTQRVMASGI